MGTVEEQEAASNCSKGETYEKKRFKHMFVSSDFYLYPPVGKVLKQIFTSS